MVRLDRDFQQLLPVDMDHSRLSSFPTRSDPLFLQIIEIIRALLTDNDIRSTKPVRASSISTVNTTVDGSDLSICMSRFHTRETG